MDGASLERELLRLAARVRAPSRRQAASSATSAAASAGDVPHRHAGELLQAEIGARREPHDIHVLLEHVDERHEQGAVQAFVVKVRGRHVRGGDHHDAALEQLREQPAEDHGVGDVGDVEFIEAKQPGLLRQLTSRKLDRILAGVLAAFHLLPERMNALVHVDHEFVEMRAALARHRARLEKQIHQHGLAAADVAVDVEAFDPRLLFRRLPNSQPSDDDLRAKRCSTIRASSRASVVDDGELRGVALDHAAGDAGGVSRCDGDRHDSVNQLRAKGGGNGGGLATLHLACQGAVAKQWMNRLLAMRIGNAGMLLNASPCQTSAAPNMMLLLEVQSHGVCYSACSSGGRYQEGFFDDNVRRPFECRTSSRRRRDPQIVDRRGR